MWRILDHTADLRVESAALTWPELLAEAACCLGALVREGTEAQGARSSAPALDRIATTRSLEARGADRVETWVHWWRAVLRLVTVEGLLPIAASVDPSSDAACARGTLACLPLDGLGPLRGVDIKAVTWHGAAAERGPDGAWHGRIVLDV